MGRYEAEAGSLLAKFVFAVTLGLLTGLVFKDLGDHATELAAVRDTFSALVLTLVLWACARTHTTAAAIHMWRRDALSAIHKAAEDGAGCALRASARFWLLHPSLVVLQEVWLSLVNGTMALAMARLCSPAGGACATLLLTLALFHVAHVTLAALVAVALPKRSTAHLLLTLHAHFSLLCTGLFSDTLGALEPL